MKGLIGAFVASVMLAGATVASQGGAQGSIAGIVVSPAADARPVPNVTLTLSGTGLASTRLAISGPDGRFIFSGLSAGSFTLTATRPGYVTTAYGAERSWRSPGIPIGVNADQHVTLQPLKIMKGAAITGRVTDPVGQPLEDLVVMISEMRTLNGQLTLSNVPALGSPPSASSSSVATTDDRGVFRIFGLPSGAFVISAYRVDGDPHRSFEPTTAADLEWAGRPTPSNPLDPAPPIGYVPIYFPGVADASAAGVLTVSAGEERAGVDFVIDPVRFVQISGTVTGPSSEPVAGARLFGLALGGVAGAQNIGLPPLGGSDAQGNFTMSGVPPGRYALVAQAAGRGGPSGQALFARTEVTVTGADVPGVNLQMSPGVTVAGRVAFENREAPFAGDLLRTRVRLTAPSSVAAIVIPPVDIQPDGSFRIAGVAPGPYYFSVVLPGAEGSWMTKAATLDTQDLTTSSLEVRQGQSIDGIAVSLTDRVTEISGVLRDRDDRPSPDYYVLVYPADRGQWSMGRERLRPAVRPGADGRYRIAGLTPGDYYIAAVTMIQPNDFADPAFLEVLVPASLKITLGPGEKKVQDVKLASQ